MLFFPCAKIEYQVLVIPYVRIQQCNHHVAHATSAIITHMGLPRAHLTVSKL